MRVREKMPEEIEFIKDRIEAIKESIHYFSNEMKPERERWVVNKLLDYLKLDRKQDEVKSSNDEPIDPEVVAQVDAAYAKAFQDLIQTP